MRPLYCHIFGSNCEGELWEGKHRQRDPTNLCSEHLCIKNVGLRLEIHSVELCGLDERQIGHMWGELLLTDLFEHLRRQ